MLYGEPSISTRESIAWVPLPPFEDSDVLVLSSRSTSAGQVGAALFYLDLRLSLPSSRASRVNWGFAGLRHTLSTSPLRFKWVHNIDSRDDGLADEGEMSHRDGLDVETGIGLNPATGQREPYEEVWRDEPLPKGSPFIFVSSSTSVEDSTAVMAALGPHAIALAQGAKKSDSSEDFHAVRMRMVQDAQVTAWEIVFSTGNSKQERELKELVELLGRAHHYVQGDIVHLGSSAWVIWDAGRCGLA